LVACRSRISGTRPLLSGLLANLAAVRQAQDRPADARQLLERALVLDQRVLGAEHPDVAVALNNLGLALRDLHEPDEARSHLERALKIDEAVYGGEHPHVAVDLTHLALVLGDLDAPIVVTRPDGPCDASRIIEPNHVIVVPSVKS
jgi:tetratricopeptide (TPR) repeat protein